jgi:hypothetical protein
MYYGPVSESQHLWMFFCIICVSLQGMEEILAALVQSSEAGLASQLEYIIKQLKSDEVSDDIVSDDEADDDDDEVSASLDA